MPEPKLSLHKKLAQVMYEAERIPKNGVAPQAMGGFRFVQVGDAADTIRKALAEKSVSMIPTAIEVVGETEHPSGADGKKIMTTLTVRTTWTLTDGDSGETTVIQSLGSGGDTGDKAAPKAQSNAMKYALLMGFLLSTGDDPEQTDTSDRQPRPAPPRLEPRPEDNLTPTGRGPQEELMGKLRRRGMIRKGGAGYDLTLRQHPAGQVFGFKLELDTDKNVAQVLVEPPVSTTLLLTYPDPAKLLGTSATVAGLLYYVKGKTPFYRLHVDRFENDTLIVPADPSDAPVPEPEAPTIPLFDEAEQARLDAAVEAAG